MLVNTVAVMLLVNCDALGRLAREGSRTAWVRYFVQYGQYADFTAAWYENVGLSVLVLMMINVSGPLLDIISDHAWQVALKCHVLRCASWPLQVRSALPRDRILHFCPVPAAYQMRFAIEALCKQE